VGEEDAEDGSESGFGFGMSGSDAGDQHFNGIVSANLNGLRKDNDDKEDRWKHVRLTLKSI